MDPTLKTDDQFEDFLDLLKLLIREPAVTGAEEPFIRVLRRELEERGAKVSHYEGLLVAEGSDPHSLMVSAHIDRNGLICTGPNEFQYAAYIARNRGDLQGDSISEQTFHQISERFKDQLVQAYEPWSGGYLGQGIIEHSFVCEGSGNMIFKLAGLDHVLPGTPLAYLDRLRIADNLVSGQLDNALSVAILVSLFENGFRGTALFSAQEEAGRSWRFLLEWFQRQNLQTDRLLVLDTSPYPDIETATQQQIVLRRRDAHAEFNQVCVGKLQQICNDLHFSWGYKEEYIARSNMDRAVEGKAPRSLGSTELGRLVLASNRAITGATLQIPTSGYHTTSESADLDSIRAILDILAILSEE